jgi:hypothetical protein
MRTVYINRLRGADIKGNVCATRCAEHVRQLGGENPLPNLMEVKG